MSESQIQDAIRLVLGRIPGLVLWRNNSGTAERHGRHIKFGVGNPGGADLIGLYNGRFVAAEIKTPIGRLNPEQKRFRDLVEKLGGIYIVLRSPEEALAWAAQL